MVDVRLLYPPEKTEAAARLAEAISAAGYGVEREALADARTFPDIDAEAGKAKALLLIWSRGLVSAAMGGTRLAWARRNSNLIEVSADGIEPAGTEPTPVILLCGWRGQPYHQGWQRILSEIARLCGAREEAAKKRRVAPSPVAAAAPPSASAPGRRPVRAAVAAVALIAGVMGAGALYQRGGDDSGPKAQPRPAMAALSESLPTPGVGTAPPSLSRPPAIQAPEATAIDARPTSTAAPAAATARIAEPAPAAAAERAPRIRSAATTERRSAPARLAASSGGQVKRYSRKNSKTMRLFCQRSGRSTPQCRTFARSMRNAAG